MLKNFTFNTEHAILIPNNILEFYGNLIIFTRIMYDRKIKFINTFQHCWKSLIIIINKKSNRKKLPENLDL